MFNIDKGVISYITRDGKEGKLSVNSFNMDKINELLSESIFCHYFLNYNLNFVHFKNVIFEYSPYFAAKDVVVILEDCIFKGSQLTIDGGSVEIINPVIFRNKNRVEGKKEINISNADDVRVVVNDNRLISYKIFAQNIEIDGGNAYFSSIDGSSIAGKNIFLNNLEINNSFNLEKVKNLSLCNSVFKGNFSLSLDIMDKLYLNNVQVFFKKVPRTITVKSPYIKINDVTLTARDYIKINDDVYSSKNGNPIVLNDSDLLGDSKVYSRRALISILKGYRDLVQDVVVKEKERDAGLASYNRLISNVDTGIKLLEDKLEMDRAELEDIKCSRDKYSKKLEKCLLDKNAYDYIKKGN